MIMGNKNWEIWTMMTDDTGKCASCGKSFNSGEKYVQEYKDNKIIKIWCINCARVKQKHIMKIKVTVDIADKKETETIDISTKNMKYIGNKDIAYMVKRAIVNGFETLNIDAHFEMTGQKLFELKDEGKSDKVATKQAEAYADKHSPKFIIKSKGRT